MNSFTSILKGASALALVTAIGLAGPAMGQEREFPWLDEEFSISSAEEIDVDALMAMMPQGLSVDYDDAEFDEETGATIIEDVEIEFDRLNGLAIEIEELVIWDLDMDYVAARLSGESAGTTGRVARRIEAHDVELTGVEEMYQGFIEAYTDVLEGSVEDMFGEEIDEEAREAMDMRIDEFEMSIDFIVFDDFRLREWELDLVDSEAAGDDWAELMPFLQRYAAWNRAFEFDGMAMEGLSAEMELTQADMTQDWELDINRIIYEGYRGGDVALNLIDGLYGYIDMDMPDDEEFEGMGPVSFGFEVDSYVVEGVALDKVMGYLARGVMPPKDETDLMSLGVWTVEGEYVSFNDALFYSVEKSVIELDDWHWLLPASLRVSVTNMSYDIEGYVSGVFDMMGDEGPSDEEISTFYDVMDVMDDYDLARPSFDYSLLWDWRPESGKASAGLAFSLDGYQRAAMLLTGTLPDYDSAADTIADDFSSVDSETLEQVFEDYSSLASFQLEMVDEGGFEKAFPMIIEVAKLFEDEQGAEFLANATPESLRGFVTGGITLGAEQITEFVPQAPAFASELVAFIEEGGRFTLSVRPQEPISAATAEEIERFTDEDDAEGLIDYLGVRVAHDGD